MSVDKDAADRSQPPESKPVSRTVRVLTSWKLWTVLLVLGVLGIGVSLTMPIVHRLRALRYFDRHKDIVEYELTDEHEDWSERYGEWANALREVDRIEVVGVTDDVLIHVGRFPEVRSLTLIERPRQPVSERGLTALPEFRRLERVEFFGQGLTDEGLARLLDLRPPLTDAVFGETGMGWRTLESLSKIPTINQLTLLNRSLDDEVFRNLEPLPNLEYFQAIGAGDQCAAWLAQSHHLEMVYLQFSNLTDSGLKTLCESRELTALHLEGLSITEEGLACLAELENLEYLGLIGCPKLTPASIIQLPDLSLFELHISADLLTPESVTRLKEMPRVGEFIVFGEVADAETKGMIDSEWILQEEPRMTEAEYWEFIRAQVYASLP